MRVVELSRWVCVLLGDVDDDDNGDDDDDCRKDNGDEDENHDDYRRSVEGMLWLKLLISSCVEFVSRVSMGL